MIFFILPPPSQGFSTGPVYEIGTGKSSAGAGAPAARALTPSIIPDIIQPYPDAPPIAAAADFTRFKEGVR
jgi:hypothetical protein